MTTVQTLEIGTLEVCSYVLVKLKCHMHKLGKSNYFMHHILVCFLKSSHILWIHLNFYRTTKLGRVSAP